MDLSVFTVEEENLICIYDVTNRTALKAALINAMPHFDEPEMCEIAENIVKKLDGMTDDEFSALSFSPTYYNENYEEGD